MKNPSATESLCLLFGLSAMLGACEVDQPAQQEAELIAESGDEQLRSNIEAALSAASDLPPGLVVQVTGGVASITGSLDCEECGGMRTPGTLHTIQQSLGAVVRAVPGVNDVQFAFAVSGSDNTN